MGLKSKLETIALTALAAATIWVIAETAALGTGAYCKMRARNHYNTAATMYTGNYLKSQQEESLADRYERLGDQCLKFREKYGLTPQLRKLFGKEKTYHYDYSQR